MKTFAAIFIACLSAAFGDVILSEDFATDPIGGRAALTGSASRFVYSPGEITMDVDLTQPPARLAWPLSRTLTEADTFTLTLEFELDAVDFDPFSNFCQISFGFINQTNTGSARTSSPADSWELLTIDYFPGAFPSYTPTFIRQNPDNGADPLNDTYLKFPHGPASFIADFDEIEILPERKRLTTTLHHDADSGRITISLADDRGGLAINNEIANPDGIESTIELQLDASYPFVFDAFALLHWNHAGGGTADFSAHSIRVETPTTAPTDLLAAAFPDGTPSPVYDNGQLTLTYLRDLTQTTFEVSAEASLDAIGWSPAPHSIINAGPGFELRRITIPGDFPSALVRFRVTAQ